VRLKTEQGADLPPAICDYAAARESLKSHIKKRVEQLATR